MKKIAIAAALLFGMTSTAQAGAEGNQQQKSDPKVAFQLAIIDLLKRSDLCLLCK